MAKKKDQPALLPADIVQVTDKRSLYYMALLIVRDVRPRFIACCFPALHDGESGQHIEFEYARFSVGQYERVGTAALVDAETGRARKMVIETARLLQEETKG